MPSPKGGVIFDHRYNADVRVLKTCILMRQPTCPLATIVLMSPGGKVSSGPAVLAVAVMALPFMALQVWPLVPAAPRKD